MRFSILLIHLSLTVFLPSVVQAAPLTTGNYRIHLQVGEALLNGRYPVVLNENVPDLPPVEGRLDVTSDLTGRITGKVEIFAQTAEVSGQIKTRKNGTSLKLRGKTADGKRVTMKATLNGTILAGTVKLGKETGPFRIDVDGVARATIDYAVSLTVATNGKITGTGTLRTDVATQSVTVRGKTKETSAALLIKGVKTMFQASGPTTETGLNAKWRAQALGAVLKGENLQVTRE